MKQPQLGVRLRRLQLTPPEPSYFDGTSVGIAAMIVDTHGNVSRKFGELTRQHVPSWTSHCCARAGVKGSDPHQPRQQYVICRKEAFWVCERYTVCWNAVGAIPMGARDLGYVHGVRIYSSLDDMSSIL